MRTVGVAALFSTLACSSSTPGVAARPLEAVPSSAAKPEGVEASPDPAPIPEAATAGQGFRAPVVEAVRITTTTDVSIVLTRADTVAPWSGPVRYTAEPFTVTGRPRKGYVRERDVLGSRRAFDLNGDGDTKDRFRAGCDGPAMTLGKTLRLEPVVDGPPAVRRYAYAGDDGQPRMGTIAAGGVSSMLYAPCKDDGTVVLGWAPSTMEVREIPGPALMVLALGNPKGPPSIPADGVTREPIMAGLEDQRFEASVYEPITDTPHWYAVAGAMIQLDPQAPTQEVRVFFDGDVEHVYIAVNEGNGTVDRATSYAAIQTLGSR